MKIRRKRAPELAGQQRVIAESPLKFIGQRFKAMHFSCPSCFVVQHVFENDDNDASECLSCGYPSLSESSFF